MGNCFLLTLDCVFSLPLFFAKYTYKLAVHNT
jgi:hypothetical protein